jgi:DNA invertase Pin-like site-specific DNA recombinase
MQLLTLSLTVRQANGAMDTATITKAGAGFKSLTDAWADTTTAHERLMLTVLGGLAEFDRELILARTGDGRKRAKARGVHFGRPPVCASAPGGHPAAHGRRYAS